MAVQVGIIMGSDNDLDIMSEAAVVLEDLGVEVEVDFLSAHRTPEEAREYLSTASDRGLKVIITGAGMSAHLGGVAAAHTLLPIVSVPIVRPGHNDAALKSNVEMPPGIPLATMPSNGGRNAGIYAAEILALSDEALAGRLKEFRQKMHDGVVAKSAKLKEIGWKAYLAK